MNLKKVLKHKSKGFSLAQLSAAGIAFVVISIILGVGSDILAKIQAQQITGSYAYNITEQGLKGLKTFGDWLPTVALVVVAAIVIGIVLLYFAGRARKGVA